MSTFIAPARRGQCQTVHQVITTKVAPDPKHWPVLVTKVKKMGLEWKGLRARTGEID
jgi:hypothetical protein